jgi:hypothetical protein
MILLHQNFLEFIITSIKREIKTRPIYDCRCDERLEPKDDESTCLAYTGKKKKKRNWKKKEKEKRVASTEVRTRDLTLTNPEFVLFFTVFFSLGSKTVISGWSGL